MSGIARRLTIRSQRLAAVIATLLVTGAGCGGVNYTAPTGSKLTISANPAEIPLTNGTSMITVTALQSSGLPVADGAHITFTTTRGEITPDATTTAGVAKATLTSNGSGGKATVTAFSGAATTATVEVTIGVTSESIAIAATPASLPSAGGSVQLSATVFGSGGAPAEGARVVFSTTQGSLASGGAPVISDANGRAIDTLTTTRTAVVTATSGSKTKDFTVNVGTTDVQSVILSADRVSLPTGGGTVNLVAVVLGSTGPISGVPVAWSASVGSLGQAGVTVTDGSGVATNSLSTSSNSIVTAAAAGRTPATLSILVGSAVADARISVSTDRGSIPAMSVPDGSCAAPGAVLPVTVTALVTDASGTPIADRSVEFFIDFDAISSCARAFGEFCGSGSVNVTAITDSSGSATVYFGATQADLDQCNCLPSGTKCLPANGGFCAAGVCAGVCQATEDLYCQVAITAVSGGVVSINSPIIEYGR